MGTVRPQIQAQTRIEVPEGNERMVTKGLYLQGLGNAGGGNRTPTTLASLRILSPVRLPVPPLRHQWTERPLQVVRDISRKGRFSASLPSLRGEDSRASIKKSGGMKKLFSSDFRV